MTDPAPPPAGVLVATPDAHMASTMGRFLTEAGYRVVVSRQPDPWAAATDVDVVLLDMTPPAGPTVDGLTAHVGRSMVPVIAFSRTLDLSAGIQALEAGADDLLTTSFTAAELAARVRSVLRRRQRAAGEREDLVLRAGPVTMDVRRRRVTVSDRPVMLTALEARLLAYLLMHPGEAFTREQLLLAVWGHSIGGTATVTVHVRRLREKLEEDPADPMLICTVWGVGYRFTTADS